MNSQCSVPEIVVTPTLDSKIFDSLRESDYPHNMGQFHSSSGQNHSGQGMNSYNNQYDRNQNTNNQLGQPGVSNNSNQNPNQNHHNHMNQNQQYLGVGHNMPNQSSHQDQIHINPGSQNFGQNLQNSNSPHTLSPSGTLSPGTPGPNSACNSESPRLVDSNRASTVTITEHNTNFNMNCSNGQNGQNGQNGANDQNSPNRPSIPNLPSPSNLLSPQDAHSHNNHIRNQSNPDGLFTNNHSSPRDSLDGISQSLMSSSLQSPMGVDFEPAYSQGNYNGQEGNRDHF